MVHIWMVWLHPGKYIKQTVRDREEEILKHFYAVEGGPITCIPYLTER